MKTEITKRQIIVLFVLIWVLIATATVMYGILPMFDEYDIAEESLYYNETQYNELLLAEPKIAVLNADIEKVTAQINDVKSFLYERMTTEATDTMLQKIFIHCGVRANVLKITEPLAIEETEYKYTPLKKETPADSAETESAVTTSDILEETSDVSEFIADIKEEETPSSGIYLMRANYAVYGEYKDILNVIAEINKLPAVTIQTVDFTAEKETVKESTFSICPTEGISHSETVTEEKLTTLTEYNLAIIVFMK